LTTQRAVFLLVAFGALALGLVHIRTLQTRAAATAVRMELKQVEARRRLWAIQARVARLRTPDEIRNRVIRFDESVVPPAPPQAPATHFAQQ